LAQTLRPGELRHVRELSTSAYAHTAWTLSDLGSAAPLLCIVEGPRALETLYQDLHSLALNHPSGSVLERLLYYPGWETLPGQGRISQDLAGDRLNVLQTLLDLTDPENQESGLVVATTVQALMQRTLPPDALKQQRLELGLGDQHDPDALAELLQKLGYDFGFEVVERGEAVRRGGLLDLWPPDLPFPLRLEFFGDELESIRSFDPATQRSIPTPDDEPATDHVVLAPARDAFADGDTEALSGSLFDFLPPDTLLLWQEPTLARDNAALYETSLLDAECHHLVQPFEQIETRAAVHPQVLAGSLFTNRNEDVDEEYREELPDDGTPTIDLGLRPCAGLPHLASHLINPERVEEQRAKFLRETIAKACRKKAPWRVEMWFNSQGASDRFYDSYLADLEGSDALVKRVGQLSGGFLDEPARRLVVAESDLYGIRKVVRGKYDPHAKIREGAKPQGVRFEDWTDIHPGELVVHVDHGIGKYLGLVEIEFNDRQQEVLSVEYNDGARLHLPVSQAHLLSRYVGIGRGNPRLHKLGGRRWNREKADAARAVQDLASRLLQTAAVRETLPGHAFSEDTTWQREFEATFPYTETADQQRAIDEVKSDMESPRPMDRLICGDVGYGKTEVAIRAAFKTVMDGKQVAMLVPTTILAQQHFESFQERLMSFPVKVDMLSRFRTRAQMTDTVKRCKTGDVDILIGTHRILSSDVGFRDLGLLIIDEEQRFGVEHKERFKDLRQNIDVLTLSATPIPRTLYLSLTGSRDMSTIQTAPRERQPIETHVEPFNEATIRSAVQREMNRGGQIFFLHNRVRTIEVLKKKLVALLPDVRIEVGHGQMSERALENVMRRFIDGKFDLLLCTTIIESGLDIPNVNTIIIDRADRFGLSELYQLRGRVGRYKHKAYAYLLVPPSGRLAGEAYHRIKAIQRYSELGSGFKLAMRDLEIRGAGNMLGSSQSGHITSVGFDLYCQLLDRTVKALKHEEVPPLIDIELLIDFVDLSPRNVTSDQAAAIPFDYIEDEVQRIQVYRKLSGVTNEEVVRELQAELRDRFGPLPPSVLSLLKIAQVRAAALKNRIEEIQTSNGQIRLRRGEQFYQPMGKFPRLNARKTGAKLDQLLDTVREWTPGIPAAPKEQPSSVKYVSYDGVVVRGHQIAGGDNPESPYPAGSIKMQTPRFRERGLDISSFHPATINVSIAPKRFKMKNPDHTFSAVQWAMHAPPEDFSFKRCRLNGVDALIYYPHPDTKPDHHQSPDVVEVLAPKMETIVYGSKVVLEIPKK